MTAAADLVRRTLEELRPITLARLCDLVSFPSVSAQGFDPQPLEECAGHLVALLDEIGFEGIERWAVDGSHPYVYGERPGPPGAPRLLLYAHYDVQPPGPRERWASHPFRPEVRDGRLYGRGAADDKAGVLVHLAAVDAWLRATGSLPVTVKVLLDGEEEAGNPTLARLLARERERLAADVVVVPDAMNVGEGRPAITCSTRGVTALVVEVRALDLPVHSGFWGGLVPDPVLALCRALGSLVDDRGRFALAPDGAAGGAVAGGAVAGDASGGAPRAGRPAVAGEEGWRRDAGVRPGVELWGDPRLRPETRLWHRPAVTVLGIDVPAVEGSSNTVQAAARARVSVRLSGGLDPGEVFEALERHLRREVGWGLEVEVRPGSQHPPWAQDPRGAAFAAAERAFAGAFGHPVTYTGMGATLPLVHMLEAALGDVPCLLTGVEDPRSRAHGIDESLHLEDWHRACLAEALFFAELATGVTP